MSSDANDFFTVVTSDFSAGANYDNKCCRKSTQIFKIVSV